jgi:hypothetical protein
MADEKKPAPGPEVLMPCKRGQDLRTKGQKCDSRMAYNLTPEQGSQHPRFQCVRCGFQWVTPVGGSFRAF